MLETESSGLPGLRLCGVSTNDYIKMIHKKLLQSDFKQ